jgi:D-alanyl-D-alanine carboxypeptidase/D-alanyl-D-alanine-endopeptidase (penicillin-binding protein 4)
MPIRFFACILLCWGLSARGELPDPVKEALRAASIPEDAIGVIAVRLSDGSPVLAHRADQPMPPASTLKPLTSLVALEKLGPGFRARTELRTNAAIVDGVLRGNLALRGGGDVDFDWTSFERMLASLRLQGVREIQGDFILDLSHFNPARTDVGAPPFDSETEFRYNVIPDALLLNTWLTQLEIASRGSTVSILPSPPLENVAFESAFDLVERACPDWEDGWKPPELREGPRGALTVRLRGEFPKECLASTAINVIDRVIYADRLFRALWKRLGGTFRGRTREGMAAEGSRLLAEHVSRSLTEITRDINKRSDNPITRVVYLALGTMEPDAAVPTAQRSERVVRSWLEARGIDPRGLVLDNGSGLSRAERIRPDQLAAVLRYGATSRWSPEFLASFPIVGVDGAMKIRLSGTRIVGRARIKTGTLRDVSAVAGYVEDHRGQTYVVVAMLHHELADRRVARPILDRLIEWVAARE